MNERAELMRRDLERAARYTPRTTGPRAREAFRSAIGTARILSLRGPEPLTVRCVCRVLDKRGLTGE